MTIDPRRDDDFFTRDLEVLRASSESHLSRQTTSNGDTEALLQAVESAHEELRVADEEVRAQQAELDQLLQSQRNGRSTHERLIAALPAAVLVTHAHGLITLANAAAAALLKTRVDAVVHKPVFAFVDKSERTELRRELTNAVAAERELQVGATLQPYNAEPVRLEVTAHHDVTARTTPKLRGSCSHATPNPYRATDRRDGVWRVRSVSRRGRIPRARDGGDQGTTTNRWAGAPADDSAD